MANNIVYKATVKVEGLLDQFYLGQTTRSFKERLGNHRASFKHASKRKDTALSEHIWDLKVQGLEYRVDWEIVKKCSTASRREQRCQLCQEEKLQILELMAKHPGQAINRRTELMRVCGHQNRELLANLVLGDPGAEREEQGRTGKQQDDADLVEMLFTATSAGPWL